MKTKKKRILWRDGDGITHMPQLSADDHTVCGIPSDEDLTGKCVTNVLSDEITCPDCISTIKLYKNL